MSSLNGKKIVVAITGSIAAYKIPHFVRLLTKAGAEVKVLITSSGADFVSLLTLSTVSGNPVVSNVADGATWNNHVDLGLWAHAIIIAPCSANTLAKLAHGLCDNIVCAVYLSARCPVFIAPAMDVDMWRHEATQGNLDTLARRKNHHLVPVGTGSLASGLIGPGRMAEPETMLEILASHFSHKLALTGIAALVTAGPTYERIDPVRFIGNFSTGKMGIAIADALADAGAKVSLVLGPSAQLPQNADVKTYHVESADAMKHICDDLFPESQVAVLAAAVADYRPVVQEHDKIKKKEDRLILELQKNPDILAGLGKIKQSGQTLIGFALETTDELEHAKEKLLAKNADMIILNSLADEGAGFGYDTNKVTLLSKRFEPEYLSLMSKHDVAQHIVKHIIKMRNEKYT